MLRWSRWELEGLSYNWRICLPPCAYTWVWCAGWLWSSSPCRSVEGLVRGSAGTRGCYLALAWHSPEVFLFIFLTIRANNSNNLEAATFSIPFCPCAFAQKRTPVAQTFKVFFLWQHFASCVHWPDSSRQRKQNRQLFNLFTPIKFSREAHQHPLLRVPDCVRMVSMFLPVLRTFFLFYSSTHSAFKKNTTAVSQLKLWHQPLACTLFGLSRHLQLTRVLRPCDIQCRWGFFCACVYSAYFHRQWKKLLVTNGAICFCSCPLPQCLLSHNPEKWGFHSFIHSFI